MMTYETRWLVIVVLASTMAAALQAQQEKVYSPVAPDRVATDPMVYDRKMLQVKDYFLQTTTQFTRWARKNKITPKTYLSFLTDDAVGSNMQCYVPKADEDLVKLVNSLVKNAEITLWGRLAYDYDAGIAHFMVDRIVKGHVDKFRKDKLEIILTLAGKKWRISRSGKYRLTYPNAKGGFVIAEFEIRLNGRVVR